MGFLTDQSGALNFDLIQKIDVTSWEKLRKEKMLSDSELNTLTNKVHDYFKNVLDEYSRSLERLESLDHGYSWGLPQGHEGLNDLFLAVCREAIEEESLRNEIVEALKALQK